MPQDQQAGKPDVISNFIGGDLANIDEFCKIVEKSLEESSTLRLPEALHDPTMSKSRQVTLKRVDNIASKKIGILLCNQEYKGVRDPEGFHVGSVFEARHKTETMEQFLKTTL